MCGFGDVEKRKQTESAPSYQSVTDESMLSKQYRNAPKKTNRRRGSFEQGPAIGPLLLRGTLKTLISCLSYEEMKIPQALGNRLEH